jgi:hypothetical protein
MKLLYDFKYNAQYCKVPTYIHLGEKDGVINNDQVKIFYDRMVCPKKMTVYSYAKHELHEDATKEMFLNSLAWVETLMKAQGCPKLGDLGEMQFRHGHLKIAEPLQNKGAWIVAAIALYYFIGFLLMKWKVIFPKRHGNQLLSWPYALWRVFRK